MSKDLDGSGILKKIPVPDLFKTSCVVARPNHRIESLGYPFDSATGSTSIVESTRLKLKRKCIFELNKNNVRES